MSAQAEPKKHHKGNKKSKDADFQKICQLSEMERIAEYITTAELAWDRGWEILHDPDGWRHDKGTDLDTGIVHSKYFQHEGRCFKLDGYVNCSPEKLFELLVVEVETSPQWNHSVLESEVVQTVTENIDIHYALTKELAGGIISRRDFVNLRHWKTKDGITLSGGCHTSHPDKKPSKKVVRGENQPGGWVFSPVKDEPNRCKFGWLVNTEFGGWLPQWTIDQALAGELIHFLGYLREYVNQRT